MGKRKQLYKVGGPVEGTFSVVGAKIEFTPSTNLFNHRLVSVKITPAVRGKNNQRLAADYDFSFRTVHASMEVIDTIPDNHAQEVAVDTTITVEFNKNVDPATVNATNLTVKKHSGEAIACNYQVTGAVVTITPNVALDNNLTIDVVVTTNVKGIDDETLSSDYPFDFLTIGAIWPNPTTDPINNAINVPINAKISATFDADVEATTVSSASFQVSIAEAP